MPYGRQQLFSRGAIRYPPALRSLTISADLKPQVVAGLLAALSPTLTDLHLTHPALYINDHVANAVNEHLVAVAPRLRALSLLPGARGEFAVPAVVRITAAPPPTPVDVITIYDTDEDSDEDAPTITAPTLPASARPPPPSPTSSRGCYAALVGALSSVRHLALSPAAVLDAGAALAPLDQLRTVVFVHAPGAGGEPMGAGEVVGLIKGGRLLEGVTVEGMVGRGWTEAEWAEVRRAAVGKGVGLS